jgi:hypothetical protein
VTTPETTTVDDVTATSSTESTGGTTIRPPSREAIAGAALAGVAAPEPVTSGTGALVLAGLTGGALVADAARRSELDVSPESVSELTPEEPTQSELEVGQKTSSELEVNQGIESVGRQEVGLGSGIVGQELSVSEETATTAGELTQDDSVVPGDFPLAGRDFPLDPSREPTPTRDPGDVIGGAETATGVTIGEGTGVGRGTGTGTSVGTGTGDTPTIDIDEIIEGIGSGREVRRTFPTGGGAVVGRQLTEEQATQPTVDIEETTRFGTGVGQGGPPQDPLGPPAFDPGTQDPTIGPGFEIGTGIEEGVGTETPPDTGTGTDTTPETGTDTIAGQASEQLPALGLISAQATVAQQSQTQALAPAQATATEPGFSEPLAAETAFGNPTQPAEAVAAPATGTGPGPRRRPRVDVEGDLEDEGDDLGFGTLDATFENLTQSLSEVDATLTEDLGVGDGPP